jgi:Zn-dependent protease with chaperone function
VAAFFIGIYRLFFPPKPQTFGIEVSSSDQPDIWSLAREVASGVGTKPVDRIVLTPDPGISVHLSGSLVATLFGGGHRVLQLGVPSLHELTVSELRAILAHEYGHFSNRDTQWTTFTYAMGTGLVAAFRATPGPLQSRDGKGGGLFGIVLALNPGYWTLLLFLRLFSTVTSAFSRIREVMADIRAMKLYGGESFAKGLVKVAFNDAVFARIVQGEVVPSLLKEEKTVANFALIMRLVTSNLSEEKRKEISSAQLNAQPETYDSHPPVATRLLYAARFGSLKSGGDTRESSELFRTWNEINENLANLYNARLVAYLRAVQSTQSVQSATAPKSLSPSLALRVGKWLSGVRRKGKNNSN